MMEFLRNPAVLVEALRALFLGWGLSPMLTNLLLYILGGFALATGPMLWVIFLIWFERKVVGRFQDRLGPNRVGPYGLLQPIADVLKLITKEDIIPAGADKLMYWAAPILSVAGVLLLWPAIPLGLGIGGDLSVGVLFLIAAGAISTMAIFMAGWSSNNKYALLGALRTVAQLVSYEVPAVLVLLIPVMLSGSMSLQDIVKAQNVWYIVYAPLAALIFFIVSVAEVGRTPFDLLEAESEIIAGFHIEYSGMKFAMFFAGEFLHAFTIGILTAVFYLGGWRGPGAETFPVLGILYLWLKGFIVYFVVVWLRATFPRIRIDHMLNFSWKFLTPLALALVTVMAVVDKFVVGLGNWPRALAHLVVNLVLAFVTLHLVRAWARRYPRPKVAEPRPVARPEPQPASGD